MTPWGQAGALAEQRLPRGAAVEKVERNQRERLFGAMVAVSTTKGYGETTVADLVEVAGVSRSTFYRHFAGKEACFLATLDAVLGAAMTVTAKRQRRAENWQERALSGVTTIIELLVAQPAAARLCAVEAYAAGPEAVGRIEATMAGFEGLATYTASQIPHQRGMPPELIRIGIGALVKIVQTRLHRHTEGELPAILPELVKLQLSYATPPCDLLEGDSKQRKRTAIASARRSEDPAERIVAAAMEAVAEQGYAETAIADLAARAGVSLRTFYEHFDGKAEAFKASLDSHLMQLLAAGLPTFRRARSWPEAVRSCAEALLAHLESVPDFTRVITLGLAPAGSTALEIRDRAIDQTQRLMTAGFDDAPQISPVVGEAILCAGSVILYERVRKVGTDNLRGVAPLITYMTVAPFLGAEEACKVALGRTRDGRRSSPRPKKAAGA